MSLSKTFILSVLVRCILFAISQSDSHYNPDKIVGVWNVVTIVHCHDKSARLNERCIRLIFAKVGNNTFSFQRNVIRFDKRIQNNYTVKINDIIVQTVPQNPNDLASEMTILDYDNDNEMVLFVHVNSMYVLMSRNMTLSEELVARYALFANYEWTMVPVQHVDCE